MLLLVLNEKWKETAAHLGNNLREQVERADHNTYFSILLTKKHTEQITREEKEQKSKRKRKKKRKKKEKKRKKKAFENGH